MKAGKVPRKVVVKKVEMVNPCSSPTPSPIKKARKIYSDVYEVMQDEEFTVFNEDLPNFKFWGNGKEIERKVLFNNQMIEYKTPIISFIPTRPKRFH